MMVVDRVGDTGHCTQVALLALQVLGIMQQFINNQQMRYQAKDARQAVAMQKMPAQCWNLQSMAVLWAVTGDVQEVDLPPLGQAIVNAPKHLIWAEAQATFSAMAQQLGMSTYTPIITMAC